MALTTSEIPHIWAQQGDRKSAAVAAVSFSGPTLYSYSTPMASFARDKKGEPLRLALDVTWSGPGSIGDDGKWAPGPVQSERRTLPVVLVNRHSYSITTSKHQSRMRQALGYGREQIAHTFEVDAPTPGSNGRGPHAPYDYAGFHAHNLADYAKRIMESDAAAQKARKPETRAMYAREAGRLIEEAQRYAAAFKVRWAWKGADAERRRIEREAKKAEKLEAARRAEYERQAREHNERMRERDADDFARWVAGEGHSAPHSYRVDPATGGVYMRRTTGEGVDNLETSAGATVPWTHAVKVFQFIRKVRESGEAFHANGRTIRVGHYHVDSIDAGGNMRAGCHFFAWPQIADLAQREGVFDAPASDEAVTQSEGAAA